MEDIAPFVLDASVFIQAARQYYAFDIAPGFWQGLIQHGDLGQIVSIDRVKRELDRGHDDLADWADQSFSHRFLSTADDEVTRCYRDVITWVQSEDQFQDAAKAEFARGADGWVVAYAMAKNLTVATQEQFNAEVRRKVPIPNVCRRFNMQPVDTFRMLRILGVRLT